MLRDAGRRGRTGRTESLGYLFGFVNFPPSRVIMEQPRRFSAELPSGHILVASTKTSARHIMAYRMREDDQ